MESTLSIAFNELQANIGVYAGFGRGLVYGEDAWPAQVQARIDDTTRSGLRRFYYPPDYEWSFLKPVASLDFASGASTVNLPDDFGGFEGQLTVLTTSSTSMPWRIDWRSEASLREMYSVTPTRTGPPMWAAQQPLKGTAVNRGQRFQLVVFPLADQAYTLQCRYYINPDYLTGAMPYAYGGAEHAETLLESCLAVWEERYDDNRGVHAAAFQDRLAASMGLDRRKKPLGLGYVGDRSDNLDRDRYNPHWWAPAITYNGGSMD